MASDTLRKSPAILCMKDAKCGAMSLSAVKARWGLFGHVMRMAHDTPAQMAIDEYITPTATAGWQGRPHTRVGCGNTPMRGDRPMPILELTYIARTFIF